MVVRGAGFTRGWATGCRLRITPAADSRSCTGPASDIISPGFAAASGGLLRGFSSPHQEQNRIVTLCHSRKAIDLTRTATGPP
jgi:hypothetical protein